MKTIWSESQKGRGPRLAVRSCDRMCSILPMSRSLCNLLLMFTPIISACKSVYIFSVAGFRHKTAVAGCWCHVVQALWSNQFQCLFKTCCCSFRNQLMFCFFWLCFYYPFGMLCIVRGRGEIWAEQRYFFLLVSAAAQHEPIITWKRWICASNCLHV